jgi:hypothetical protein
MELSGLESAETIDAISVMAYSIYDGLGQFGLFSTVRWSCIGRVPPEALILTTPISSNDHRRFVDIKDL